MDGSPTAFMRAILTWSWRRQFKKLPDDSGYFSMDSPQAPLAGPTSTAREMA